MSDPFKILLLVDGTCVFCNRLVSFILRHDRSKSFRFAHVQGPLARAVLARHSISPDIDAIYAITRYGESAERVHIDGAAGRIIWPRVFPIAAVLRVVPLFLLNLQYKLFAKLRYRLFGQAKVCIAPRADQRALFLE